MPKNSLSAEKEYVIQTLSAYWKDNEDLIFKLPLVKAPLPIEEKFPPELSNVSLPSWASDIGIDGDLLVPNWTIIQGEKQEWERTDWLSAMFWYIHGSAERAYESLNGPIHSNSFYLKNWDQRMWDRAWVNRMALFLRRWSAKISSESEDKIFGPLPTPKIILTHDVDAVQKTLAIRFKQTSFTAWSSVRCFFQGKLILGLKKIGQAARFLFSNDDYWCFDQIKALENRFRFRSHFNFYAGNSGLFRNLKKIIFDPNYDILSPRLVNTLKKLKSEGWEIGLHPSFDTWENEAKMRKEKARLEKALEGPIEICRQHWLKFSWLKTWKIQESAGFKLDTTLGFNDRPGFRNGIASSFQPWDIEHDNTLNIKATPMILMDSHLHNYKNLILQERENEIESWTNEIQEVHGTATIVWHQRTISRDYGWYHEYEYLLSLLNKANKNLS